METIVAVEMWMYLGVEDAVPMIRKSLYDVSIFNYYPRVTSKEYINHLYNYL